MSNKFVAYLNWVLFVLLCGISNNYTKFMFFFYRLQGRSERGGHGKMSPPRKYYVWAIINKGKGVWKWSNVDTRWWWQGGGGDLYREGGSTARGKRSPPPLGRGFRRTLKKSYVGRLAGLIRPTRVLSTLDPPPTSLTNLTLMTLTWHKHGLWWQPPVKAVRHYQPK